MNKSGIKSVARMFDILAVIPNRKVQLDVVSFEKKQEICLPSLTFKTLKEQAVGSHAARNDN